MPVPIVYRGPGVATPQYEWLDLTTGVGYRRFYPCGADGGIELLTVKAIDCDTENSKGEHDDDFDITFKRPAQIKGTAFFNVTGWMHTGNAGTTTLTLTITVYHVTAGAAETSLGSVAVTFASTATSADKAERKCCQLDLTEKQFQIGEKLRINVGAVVDNGGTNPGYYICPSSNITGTDTTRTDFTCDIPFKADV